MHRSVDDAETAQEHIARALLSPSRSPAYLSEATPTLQKPRPYLPEELLVIRQLDDKRHVEGVLEPLGEDEGDEVAKVHRLGGGSSPGVQEEWVALLVASQDVGEVAMREEDASPQQVVRRSGTCK